MSMQTQLDLEQKAIQAAKIQDWEAATAANSEILVEDPSNVQALIRLGVIKAQINKNTEAKRFFEQALEIDKSNSLIKKHLLKLKNKQPIHLTQLHSAEEFIEEPGKTKIVELHRLASKDQLIQATVGNLCTLKPKSRYMSVELDGKYLGSLPEDLSARLNKLINSGNTYACYVQSVSPTSCSVFLKEQKRSKQNEYVNSFPVNKAQLGPLNEIYMADEAMPLNMEDVPFQVLATDDDDDDQKTTGDAFPIDDGGDERDRERENRDEDNESN